jgi:SOS-response transcriptional repressor LexA
VSALTPRQRDTLEAIKHLTAQTGTSPTLREIAREIKSSVTGAHNFVEGLKERGFIYYPKKRARSIRVLFESNETVNWESIARMLYEQNTIMRGTLTAKGLPCPIDRIKL